MRRRLVVGLVLFFSIAGGFTGNYLAVSEVSSPESAALARDLAFTPAAVRAPGAALEHAASSLPRLEQHTLIGLPGFGGQIVVNVPPSPEAQITALSVKLAEAKRDLTDDQRIVIAKNEKVALARLQKFSQGGSLFESDEQPVLETTLLGPELVYGGYRYTATVIDSEGRRLQCDPAKIPSGASSFYVYAWPNERTSGVTAFALDKVGDIAANAAAGRVGPGSMTANCNCSDRFVTKRSVRGALGYDEYHGGGEWKLVSAGTPVGN